MAPHCRRCPSEDDRFAAFDLLMISIFWDAVKKAKKTAAGYGMELSPNKSKILVNSIKPMPSTSRLYG